jgi:hypothetical protein
MWGCQPVYDEFSSIDPRSWIRAYLNGCNAYAQELFKKALNSECIGIIIEGLSSDGDIWCDHTFDVGGLYEKVANAVILENAEYNTQPVIAALQERQTIADDLKDDNDGDELEEDEIQAW